MRRISNPFLKRRFRGVRRVALSLLLAGLAANFPNLPAQAGDPDDPEVEKASFQVADGFEVSLFASERDGVVKPIQMRFDPRGRLWVIGSTVYPQIKPSEIPNDKVLILEDTRGRGVCDKVTVFADGLMIPTGIELADGGAYVGQGTEMLFLRDSHGGDHADERRVVLRGFGTGDAHQMINSFLFGPGGELWFCQGLHVRSHVETPWGIANLEQAGIWCLQPRRVKLEGFYGSQHEPQNPWGFVFTDWEEPIVLAGNYSSVIYPVPGLVVNHRDDAPSVIWKNGAGRKLSGGDIVGTKHFPDSWQGDLIVGGYINNAVWTLKISDDGSGFQLTDLPPLIKSTSRSFRPVDVKFGPDGALYLCDWYNPIIGHYQASFRHPDRDKAHGRIWRVTAKGRPLTSPPKLAQATMPELLEDLRAPDRWTRRFAKRALADRPSVEVASALDSWVARPDLTAHDLTEALGVYASQESVAPELLARLSRSQEPGARAYAAEMIGRWADRLPSPLAMLRPLVGDENARVRLHAVIACAQIPKAEAMEVAAVAADLPSDKFLAYALNQTVFALKPYWLPALRAGKLNLENKVSRLGMMARADGTSDTLVAVRGLLASDQLADTLRETYLHLLIDLGDANDLSGILNLPDRSLEARLMPQLLAASISREVRPSGDLSARVGDLIKSDNPELRAGGLQLAGAWKLEPLRPVVEHVATNSGEDEESRRAAIAALGGFQGAPSSAILARLASQGAPRVRAAAIVALSRLGLSAAASSAANVLAETPAPSVVEEVLTVFLLRKGGTEALVRALIAKAPSKATAQAGLQLLSAGGRQESSLTLIFRQTIGGGAQLPNFTLDQVSALSAEVQSAGDAKRGDEIFHRPQLGCVSCHAVNGKGADIGPDLGSLGSAQPVDFIIGAILEPQKEIKEGYISTLVTTVDGEEYQGYVVSETKDEVVLRDILQRKLVRFSRKSIKEQRQNGSVMPSGLVEGLSRAEFSDLVRYLSELGRNK